MTYVLIKKNSVFYSRAARHWWLTGFRLGEYTRPSALTMEASITFREHGMLQAFLDGLRRIGYTDDEVRYSGNTVLILFTKPHSKQPFTRHGLVAWIALRQDKRLVGRYRKLIKGNNNIVDILVTLKEKAPILYDLALGMGRNKGAYKEYDKLGRFVYGI
jgi:hypothetical protein